MTLFEYKKLHGRKHIYEIAKKTGNSGEYLCQIANGHRSPSAKLAQKIERFTNGEVTIMELLYPPEEKAA